MKKQIIALILCLVMIIPVFASCAHVQNESIIQIYLGQQVYDLDPLYAFNNDAQLKIVGLIFSGLYKIDDRGRISDDLAQKTEVLNDDVKDEYKIRVTLKTTCWSDGSGLTSDDVVFVIKRALKAQNNNPATALLLNIKNASKVKEGTVSIDDLAVTAPSANVIEITMEKKITNEMLDEFKIAFSSPALFPLRESYVQDKTDWAKKQSSIVCSGPYILRKASYEIDRCQIILERNEYYLRDREKDAEDKFVTPYRIVINYEEEDQVAAYDEGLVMFLGNIPYIYRDESRLIDNANVTDALSTHTYYFNRNAYVYSASYAKTLKNYFGNIDDDESSVYLDQKDEYEKARTEWQNWRNKNTKDVKIEYPVFPEEPKKVLGSYTDDDLAAFIAAQGEYNDAVGAFKAYYSQLNLPEAAMPAKLQRLKEDTNKIKLFEYEEIRKALSMAIDREAIARTVVFAKPATGLVNERVFNTLNAKSLFRKVGGSLIDTSERLDEAVALIQSTGIDPSLYSFTIRVRENDDVHNVIAGMVAESWNSLGFKVNVEPVGVIVNDDVDESIADIPRDIRDDLFNELVYNGNNYQVMAFDLVSMAPTAFAVLAPYARDFSGNKTVEKGHKIESTHSTGYNSDAYNELITKAFNESNADKKAEYLHQAEKLLIEEDMAVMPVVFNQTASLTAKDINKRSISLTYYGFWNLSKLDMKNWQKYRDEYFPETTEDLDLISPVPSNGDEEETEE